MSRPTRTSDLISSGSIFNMLPEAYSYTDMMAMVYLEP
jgi:hypothetical protein